MYKKYRFNISCGKMVGFNLRFVLVFVFREMVSCSICSFSLRYGRPSVHPYYSCYLSKSGQITQERIMKLIDIPPPLPVSVHETIACKVLHQLFTLQLILVPLGNLFLGINSFPKFKSCLISINFMKIQPGFAAILLYQAYNLQILKQLHNLLVQTKFKRKNSF